MNANQEFKFPDETPDETEEALEIKVVDDTPAADKGRQPLPKEIVEELDKDDLEEYSDKVKRRMAQMKKVYHDERREKEAAQREKEEAIRFAQAKDEEVRGLKKRLGVGEKLFVQEVSKAANDRLTTAREKLQAAIEAGDSKEIAAAQEALTDAKLSTREASQLRPSLQEDEEGVQQPTQEQSTAVPVKADPRAEAWRKDNTWFGSDEEMTSLALGLHQKLVNSGVDPKSDSYYEQIDATMRKRFPENFEEKDPEPDPDPTPTPRQQAKPATPRKSATPVAPATRTTAPRQVTLTPSQVALAKRLGVSNEAYARQLIKLEKEQSNG